MKATTRQQTRRRRGAQSYALRLAGAAALVVVAVVALTALAGKVVHPYLLGYHVGREADHLRTQLAQHKERNALLRAQVRYLQSDEGGETAARRAGWHRPGEQVYLLKAAPKPSEALPGSGKNATDGR